MRHAMRTEGSFGHEPKMDEQSKEPYVSIGQTVHLVHSLGGSTKDIIGMEQISRMNELQKGVAGFSNSLAAPEWNELMGLKQDAQDKMKTWIDSKTVENSQDGKVPYVETTDVFRRAKDAGGHITEICDPVDVDVYRELQPRAAALPIEDWNRLMQAKSNMLEAVKGWLQSQ